MTSTYEKRRRRGIALGSVLLVSLAGVGAWFAGRPTPLDPIEDRPGLPRVLVIGDSISVDYTLPLRRRLGEVANLHRVPDNARSTSNIMSHFDEWVGDERWDFIVLNSGLHDVAYDHYEQGDQRALYRRNLEKILDRLERTGAVVFFATTTPAQFNGARDPLVPQYNAVAREVMEERGIEVIDLYGVIEPHFDSVRVDDLHFGSEGSEMFAATIAEAIGPHLADAARD